MQPILLGYPSSFIHGVHSKPDTVSEKNIKLKIFKYSIDLKKVKPSFLCGYFRLSQCLCYVV